MNNIDAFIKEIPKSDLHVHLDGSIRLSTLIDLSRKENRKLPSETVEGLEKLVFKDSYKDLGEYLTCFGYTVPVMQNPENLERIAYEFAIDNQKENVSYVEVRFAPQLHMSSKMNLELVLTSINRGFKRAQQEYNITEAVKSREKLPFIYGIIVCAMRSFGRFSDYYGTFIDAHPFSSDIERFSMCSSELIRGVIQVRDNLGIPIVGFDLAGQEDGFPADDHEKAYRYAHKNFLHKTVHAGEAYGAESIFQALTDLHADRIGHGYYLFDESKIQDRSIVDRKRYINRLIQFMAEKRITIEVCLTSNLQTNPSIIDIKNHNFQKMLDNKLSIAICTDNRTVSKTTVSNELRLAYTNFDISIKNMENILSYGLKRSFFPGNYLKKREYVRSAINIFNKKVEQFGLNKQ